MTAYESIIKEGREQGKLTQSREVLTRLISKKFQLDDADRKMISEAVDLEKIAQALDEIIVADTSAYPCRKNRCWQGSSRARPTWARRCGHLPRQTKLERSESVLGELPAD